MTVNGSVRTLTVEPRMTLLDALREKLALTGPKKSCDRGECGACTVHIEGRRVLSCMTLAVMHGGQRWELGQVKPMPLAQRSLALLEDLRSRLVKRYGEKRAREWLRQPNRGLRGNPPIDVLVASGPMLVRDIVTGPEAATYR